MFQYSKNKHNKLFLLHFQKGSQINWFTIRKYLHLFETNENTQCYIILLYYAEFCFTKRYSSLKKEL